TWIAAATERLRIGTSMLILPQRHPILLAKEVATLDRYSKGRITLGVGVGWVEEEVRILKQSFKDRGRRADEWIEILRALWTDGVSKYQGRYFEFDNIASYPKPVQAGGIPIMIGGHSAAAAARAGRYGDEFYPHWSTRGPNEESLAELKKVISVSAEAAGRRPSDVRLTLTSTSDAKTAYPTAELCARLGAERVVVLPPKGELDGALPDELARFKATVIDQFPD
ncbi:TIGR03619 family F420-dependent LLM class oxidoreductase, partial [Myxococcota bacterium]|nr:TIGR03619 family F420-dependent LLM class oxidoreductase [Myxococcota bacterium]